ncbi:MAG: hypothetical protein R2745_17305 [Vicinamibacterales bacterium]
MPFTIDKALLKQIPRWIFAAAAASVIALLVVSFVTGRTFVLFNAELGVRGRPAFDLESLPKGTILAWYSRDGQLPTGWAICDGSHGTPNLVGRFLMGAANFGGVGQPAGSDAIPQHDTLGHVLTEPELARHSHEETLSGGSGSEDGYTHLASQSWSTAAQSIGVRRTGDSGADQPHSHEVLPIAWKPSYDTVLFIMKTT